MKTLTQLFNRWLVRFRYNRCARQAARIVASTKLQYPGCESAMATATWPPVSGTTPGYAVKGKTTIQWGTDGLLSSPFPGGGGFYTVLRYSEKLIVDQIKLPCGTGNTSSAVFVVDGVGFELTVRDDSGITPPTLNTAVTIVDASGLIGNAGLVYTARVIEPSYDTSVKQAGERILMCENLLLIDSQTGSAQTAR